MTPAELEQGRRPTGNIDVKMVQLFLFFLILPYLLFFGLLMLLTGEIDVVLLFESVTKGHSMVVVKAWVIGTFVLSVAAAIFLSIYTTEKFIARRLSHPAKPASRKSPAPAVHFVIESREKVEESEASKARHNGLESVIVEKEQ